MIEENIKPIFWGHVIWEKMFMTASVYPQKASKELIKAVQNEFIDLETTLPCHGCRVGYSSFNKKKPTDIYDKENFKTRDKLIELIWNLRNKVNDKVGLEYNITLKYFKTKLNLMTCNKKDGIVWTMTEAPFIQEKFEEKIFKFIDDNKTFVDNYKQNYTRDLIKIMKNLINNINEDDFDLENKHFNVWYERNRKCDKLKRKIYRNMTCNDYDYDKSLEVDKILYVKLFYLGCSIIPLEDMKRIFK